MPARSKVKPGALVRICFSARNGGRAQLSHSRKVIRVESDRSLVYMSLYGFEQKATSWVRVARKLPIAKYVLPPESDRDPIRETRQAGSARTYG